MHIARNLLYHKKAIIEGSLAEEDETETNEVKGQYDSRKAFPATWMVVLVMMKYVVSEKLMKGKCYAVHATPCNKVKACPVP